MTRSTISPPDCRPSIVKHGSGAVGWYFGNPTAFSYSHLMAVFPFIKGLGRHTHLFTASSQDTSNRMLASQFLYGAPVAVPIPDLMRTDLLVMLGSNPVVSHGSFLTTPRIREHMHDIVKRGGRVVVVDPRKTETAAQFEWLGIVPDGDSYLLLSLMQVMFAEGLVDIARVSSQADGLDWLRGQCAPFTPESTAERTGIDPDAVRQLARDLVASPRAAVYGRFGTCVGRNGTLTAYSDRRGQSGCRSPRQARRQRVRHAGSTRSADGDGGPRRRDAPHLSAKAFPDRRIRLGDRRRTGRADGQRDSGTG